MSDPITPNEERSAEEELTETSFRDPDAAGEANERSEVETTVTDGAHVLDELGEDVASSPAQRARPKPGPPVKDRTA